MLAEGGENNPALLKILLETRQLLKQVEFYFRGGEVDEEGTVRYNSEMSLMNERGVNRLFAYLRPRISKLFTITRLQEKDIRDMVYRFRMDINVLLYKNAREYGVNSEDFIPIANLCEDLFKVTAYRSIQGKEISGILQQWSREENENQKGGGGNVWFPSIPSIGQKGNRGE